MLPQTWNDTFSEYGHDETRSVVIVIIFTAHSGLYTVFFTC